MVLEDAEQALKYIYQELKYLPYYEDSSIKILLSLEGRLAVAQPSTWPRSSN
jgi:hypothetical protein